MIYSVMVRPEFPTTPSSTAFHRNFPFEEGNSSNYLHEEPTRGVKWIDIT